MTGAVQGYPWGSTTVLPRFLGREPDGTPQAELWLGAHSSAPSTLGGESLDRLVDADPIRVVGEASVQRFGPRLPYLLKVLAADQPLSLQAHPSRSRAEAGFAADNAAGLPVGSPERVFADDWPKPEMMVALTPVEALCGFRDPTRTYELFARLDVPGVSSRVRPLAEGGADALAGVLRGLLGLTTTERSLVSHLVAAAAALRHPDAELAEFADTAVLLDRYFPGDPGVLAALLLNRLRLDPGDALYLPAGNLHAYLGGSGVEVMANSDNTLRGGLTSKLVSVDALLSTLDFTPSRPPLVEPVAEADGRWRYPTPAPEFRLWRLEPAASAVEMPARQAGRVLLVVAGELTLHQGADQLVLRRGEAAFCFPGDVVSVRGTGTAFVAGPGV